MRAIFTLARSLLHRSHLARPIRTMAVCPYASSGGALPAGHPPLPQPATLHTFTLDSLRAAVAADASTSSSPRRLIALKGGIFDVAEDARFHPDGRWSEAVGRDLTRTLAFEPFQVIVGTSPTSSAPLLLPMRLEPEYQGASALVGLGFDELRTLETWFKLFETQYPLVGRLMTENEQVTDAPRIILPGEAHLQPLPSDIYGCFLRPTAVGTAANGDNNQAPQSLHAVMDTDDQEASR